MPPSLARPRYGRRSTAACEENLGEGPDKDLDVEPERPVLDVVVVEARTVGDGRVPAQATDLGEPGETGLHPVAVGVAVVLGGEPVDEVRPLRPGTHQRHVAPEDVPQLRQLVEGG